MQRQLTEREQWLIDRIGKVLYRPRTSCKCEICENVYLHGIIVGDRNHALYLSEIELEYTADGTPIQYFDTRQEAIDFEKQEK